MRWCTVSSHGGNRRGCDVDGVDGEGTIVTKKVEYKTSMWTWWWIEDKVENSGYNESRHR